MTKHDLTQYLLELINRDWQNTPADESLICNFFFEGDKLVIETMTGNTFKITVECE